MAGELPLNDRGENIVRIGHSPDPDDAFMFHAMTTNAFETPGYDFVHELQDIETLNHRAMRKELEVSAVSIHAYPEIAENYALMNCGASMGEGYGPMIVAKQGVSEEEAKAVRDKFDATYMQSINPIDFKGANSENSKCWDGYVKKGTKPSPTRPGVTVNNSVKK